MKLANFRFKYFITNMIVVLLYPIYRYVSNNNSLLAFSDACFIIGLFLLIVGIVLILYGHGDFDITGFIASRAFANNKEDFDSYLANQKEKRKDSFNYPLLCGIILIVLAGISALAV